MRATGGQDSVILPDSAIASHSITPIRFTIHYPDVRFLFTPICFVFIFNLWLDFCICYLNPFPQFSIPCLLLLSNECYPYPRVFFGPLHSPLADHFPLTPMLSTATVSRTAGIPAGPARVCDRHPDPRRAPGSRVQEDRYSTRDLRICICTYSRGLACPQTVERPFVDVCLCPHQRGLCLGSESCMSCIWITFSLLYHESGLAERSDARTLVLLIYIQPRYS